jgi:hypothetical protein
VAKNSVRILLIALSILLILVTMSLLAFLLEKLGRGFVAFRAAV